MTDTMRDKFEVWYAEQYPDPIPDHAAGEARIIKDNRWHVWQAAQSDAKALVGELQPYLWHKNQCDFVNSFTKDCTCGYPEALTKAQAFMEGE